MVNTNLNCKTMHDINIKALLESDLEAWSSAGSPLFPFLTAVLEKGQQFENAPFEGYGRRRRAKRCYDNALNLATDHDLRYVEGFGLSGLDMERRRNNGERWYLTHSIWRHAWCIDAKGKVVDPTWEYHENTQYMGAIIDIDFAWRKVESTGYYGVISEARADNLNAISELYPEYKAQCRAACRTPRRRAANK